MAALRRLSTSDMEAHGLTRKQPLDRTAGEPLSQAIARRLLDVVVAGTIILLLSPLLLALALAIRLDSRGPALFRQRRVGYGQREFTVLKFRSMRSDADPRGHRDYVTALIKGKTAPTAAAKTSTSSPSTTGSPRSAAGSGAGASTSCRSSSTSSPATWRWSGRARRSPTRSPSTRAGTWTASPSSPA